MSDAPAKKGAPAQPLVTEKKEGGLPEPIAAEAADLLERELRRNIRDPFKRALGRMLQFRPTADALQAFADRAPDRWALAVSTLASVAGYERGINVTVTRKNVNEMSDAELLEEFRKNAREIGVVELKAVAQGTDGGAQSLPAPTEEKK